MEFEGHLREAALIRFDQSNDDLTKRFTAEGNSQALARLEILRNYTAAQAELNQITTDSGLVTSQLANEELRIDVARRTGAMTELGALQALGTERQKAVDQLSVFYQKYAEIAEVSGNPKLIQDAKNLESQLGSLAAQTDLVGQKFQTLFANSASNALVQFSQGTVSATGAFKLFANSIISELVRMTTQAAAMKLFGGLFGQGGGGSAGKTGLSILGSLLGAFGGGVGKVASVGKLGSSTFGQSLWPVPKFAKGGVFGSNVIPFAKGGIVDSPTSFKFASGGMMQNGLMGEAGPEAIMPLKRDSSGRLGVSAGGGGGSKSMVINYNPTVNIDSRSDRASIIQDMQRINKQGQADLVEKLTRQGAI